MQITKTARKTRGMGLIQIKLFRLINKQVGLFLFITAFSVSLFFVLISSSFSVRIGNTFFGGVPLLYNVNLAQFFFFQATQPLFGKAAPYSNHQLSRTYFIKGDLREAVILANKELELYPENIATYYILGLTLGYMDKEEEAIEAFTKFIAYKPNSWAARNDKAWLQFRLGDIDGAMKTIEPIATESTNPWVQNTYGILLLNQKRCEESSVALDKAKKSVLTMTSAEWGKSYPGNDPRVYDLGLEAMKESIEENLTLLKTCTSHN